MKISQTIRLDKKLHAWIVAQAKKEKRSVCNYLECLLDGLMEFEIENKGGRNENRTEKPDSRQADVA